jgi:hypothetical protein
MLPVEFGMPVDAQFKGLTDFYGPVYGLAVGNRQCAGRPRHTGHTWRFGSESNCPTLHWQNIPDSVFSSTWISNPITGSYVLSVAIVLYTLFNHAEKIRFPFKAV